MRVLHLLHRSVPGTSGYCIRSREIVAAQRGKGLEPMVVTSPSQAPLAALDLERSEYIDGVRYFRTGSSLLPATREVYDKSPVRSALRVFQNFSLLWAAFRVAKKYGPAVIHGHSPFTCGLVANAVGRMLGNPCIYEMRGIWEGSHTSRYGISEKSLRYQSVRALENKALRGADLCCVISEALKQEVLSRGISRDKVFIEPNGVNVKTFVPGPPKRDLQEKLGLGGRTVVGYIGAFFAYEGLDFLVDAMIGLAPEFPELSLLLVGDGELMPKLRQMVAAAGISDRIVFTGRVPYREAADYYRLCDLMVLPRRDTRDTQMVTPLKPLEIMAMEKPLIASDIGGHREIVQDGVNCVLFVPEDVADLESKMRHLLRNRAWCSELGSRARRWVQENRDWDVLADRYVEVYNTLAAKNAAQ
jgi:PEP-CTERM/exosortase A-associated glycosyltransferase